MLLPFLCALLPFLSSFSVVYASESAPVKVWLRSSWPAPNLLIEIIETVALEFPDRYFAAFDLLTVPSEAKAKAKTAAEVYESSISTLSEHAYLDEPGSLASLELLISLHAATPKIVAFHQYYTDVYGEIDDLPKGCTSWVAWYGEKICDVVTLADRLESGASQDEHPGKVKILPFDHIHPDPATALETPSRTAILYVSADSSDFHPLHSLLYTASSGPNPRVQYIVRYIPAPVDILDLESSSTRNYLTGYGVGLDLKKTDYLAMDDRHSSSEGSDPSSGEENGKLLAPSDDHLILEALRDLPELDTPIDTATPLEETEIQGLGPKAVQLILNSSEPLTMLRQLSQNFPKYATTLARRVEDPPVELLEEISANRMLLPQGFNGLWLNGQMITDADFNPLNLLRLLRKERRRILSLTSLGLSSAQAIETISYPAIGRPSQTGSAALEGYFDASDRIEGGDLIVWWNDMEKDSRYARWSPSLTALLRGAYGGQFHNIRRNLNNIITVLDVSLPASAQFITGPVPTIINRNLPFRFGLVPIVETEAGKKAARLLFYSTKRFGRSKTIKMFQALADPTRTTINFDLAHKLYDDLVRSDSTSDSDEAPLPFDVVVSEAQEEQIQRAIAYSHRLSTTTASFAAGHAFINGKHFDFTEDFLRHVQIENAAQTQFLQEEMYLGKLIEDEAIDMSVYFYDLPTTAKRRNQHIYPSSKAGSLQVFNLPELFEQVGIDRSSLDYLYPAGDGDVPLTVWVVGDFNVLSHVELLREAISAVNSTTSFRIGYLHIQSNITESLASENSVPSALFRLTAARALSSGSADDVLSVLDRISPRLGVPKPNPDEQAVLSEDSVLHRVLSEGSEVDSASYRAFVESGHLLGRSLGLNGEQPALLVNGRLVGPLEAGGFSALDFDTLCSYELQKRISPVVAALSTSYPKTQSLDRTAASELVAMASSVISAAFVLDPSAQSLFQAPPLVRQRPYLSLGGDLSSFQIGDNSSSVFQIGVIIDPLSESSQKWTTLIEWLSQIEHVHTFVVLNPTPLTQLPLKRFYRYNLPHRLSFDESGAESQVSVEFHDLPPEPIYTLSMDVAQSWLVRPRESQFDLDNIHLASLSPSERPKGVEAVFDLDFLVIEGHAREPSNAPPRGVQLQLTAFNSTVPIADTLVMANLGYLQFRAKPGVFQLGVRPGRGREVYEMESVGNEGWESPHVDVAGDEVTLTSFEGLTLYPRLKRREGMEDAEVLDESLHSSVPDVLAPMVSWVKSRFGSKSTDINPAQAEINIFTVASGLLYERFVGIMILSVLKNTKSTVKFWFIENFLSPSFLEFIPHLAEAYGFQYELVTYKWPSWLRAQTEKQRVIWAYKILFLDVLFPMDLKRVIFVDADQIVRADLKELVDLDLQGAPYGYTPMGDDNEDMEGFRFWKTGYWLEFLRGKPYHISALYVIDLVRFRQLAAGDRLRGQYQGLSADPNSLSNLDQDLPNNLQHEVPIFSLDKNWLWCETWCSKDRLDQAKTIDLCQNPLTKEPKLSRARQIPEWEKYDSEIATFAQSLVQQGKIQSHAAAASANDLASIGTKSAPVDSTASDAEEDSTKAEEKDHTRDEL